VRAVTRDPSKPAAQSLAAQGAEVVAGDFNDEDSIRAAFKGAYAIYDNTDFWTTMSVEAEVKEGTMIARVASEVPTLKHFLFSGFVDARQLAGGKYQSILHYNAKTAIADHIKTSFPDLWAKTTVLWIGYYYQNWLKFQYPFGPVKVSIDLLAFRSI
jgi:uncharacterized protein YbjT (DUF2867 family)